MVTTIEQIDKWRRVQSEHENLEFKEARNQFDSEKLYRYCVAIANEGGGFLILGIKDRPPREIVGSNAFPNVIETTSKIREAIGFRVDIEEVSPSGKRILVFHIPSRPRGTAYEYKGSYLMRSGEELVPMSEDRLRRIFAEGQPDWLYQPAIEGFDDAKVIELLDSQSYFDLLSLPYPSERSGVLQRFESEKIISTGVNGWTISNLGAILFAKRLDAFQPLARKAPRVIVYDGKSKLRTKQDFQGKMGYAVGFQGLIEFINRLVPSNEVIEGALRHQAKMFPDIAIRELVANALIHQDFNETGTSVVVEIYDDRMEISNPGTPFIDVDRFIDEYQSRNERLADIMRRLGICEEKGSGIDKVVSSAEAFQLPAPDFRAGQRRTTVVLFGHKEVEDMDRNDRIRACYQHCCLRYVMNDRMNNQSLRERLKLPESKTATVSQIISATIDAGRIKIADTTQTSTRYRSYIPYWA